MRDNPRYKRGLLSLINTLPSDLVGLEIGCYAGESSTMFAASGKFKKLYCVDPWKADYYAHGQMPAAEAMFDKLLDQYRFITKCKTTAAGFFENMNHRGLNFIYIDGNHKYSHVKSDIISSLNRLGAGGIIAGHDYGFRKAPGVQQAVDELLGYPDAVFCDTSWIKIID
jgi:predicted O-methyltransferase YrrM